MFEKRMKKAVAVAVALMLMLGAPMLGALADDFLVEVIGADDTSSNQTQSSGGGLTTSSQPDPQTGTTITTVTPSEGSSSQTNQTQSSGSSSQSDSGTESSDPKAIWRVNFYDQFNNLLGGVDVQDGNFIIEPENKPYHPGSVFLFWYDYDAAQRMPIVPYEFGTQVHKHINLVPYFATLPTTVGGAQQIITQEQERQVVEQIIAAGQTIHEMEQNQQIQPQVTMSPEEVNQVVGDILDSNRQSMEDANANYEERQVATQEEMNAVASDIISSQNNHQTTQENAPITTTEDILGDAASVGGSSGNNQSAVNNEIAAEDLIGELTGTGVNDNATTTTTTPTSAPVQDAANINEIIPQVTEMQPETGGVSVVIDTQKTDDLISEILAGGGMPAPEETEQPQAPVENEPANITDVIEPLPAPQLPELPIPSVVADETSAEEQGNTVMTNQQVDDLISDIIGDMLQSPAAPSAPETEPTEPTDGAEITAPPAEPTDTTGSVPGIPDASTIIDEILNGTDNATEAPEVTPEPEETEVPEETAEPEETEVPEETTEPEETEDPDATPDPDATVDPDATPDPDATVDPDATPDPDATEDPDATPDPDATEDPDATPDPDATVDPDATPDPDATEDPEGEDELTEEGELTEEEVELTEEEGELTEEEGELTEGEGEPTEEEGELTEEEGEGTGEELDVTEGEETEEEPEPEFTPPPKDYDTTGMDVEISMTIIREGAEIGPDEPVFYGDTVRVRGFPVNPDGIPYTLQWQRNTGAGWEDIQGETNQDYFFTLTEESLYWNFRVVMIVDAATETVVEGESTEAGEPQEVPVLDEAQPEAPAEPAGVAITEEE